MVFSSSFGLLLFFFPPQLLKSFQTGNSRTSWWDKFWLKNSTFVSNTRLLNKINVGYHCPESWVQGMEWISRKFSILNGKYLKKPHHRVQYNSARGQFWPETEPEASPVCGDAKHRVRFPLSLFLLNLVVGKKENIAMWFLPHFIKEKQPICLQRATFQWIPTDIWCYENTFELNLYLIIDLDECFSTRGERLRIKYTQVLIPESVSASWKLATYLWVKRPLMTIKVE